MKPWQYYTRRSKTPQIMDDIKSRRKIKVCPYLYKKFQLMKAMENKKTLSIKFNKKRMSEFKNMGNRKYILLIFKLDIISMKKFVCII